MTAKMRPGAEQWLRTATADEKVLAAEVSVLACNASGRDLARLALSVGLEAHWGEEDAGLRARCLWRARYYSRIRHVEPQPPVLLRWWAQAVLELPESWRPAARRLVDRARRADAEPVG